MSLRVLLRDSPGRSIALVAGEYALVFQYGHTNAAHQPIGSPNRSAASKCLVEFLKLDDIDSEDYRSLRPRPVHGTLGLVNVKSDVYLCTINGAVAAATVRPGETVQKITSVDFFCLNRSTQHDYDQYGDNSRYGVEDSSSVGIDYSFDEDQGEAGAEDPCMSLKRLLSSGTFYYSSDFDLTNRLQDRYGSRPTLRLILTSDSDHRAILPLTWIVLMKAFFGTPL